MPPYSSVPRDSSYPLHGEKPADIGTMVVDDSLTTVGHVVDVFGSVEHPYVAVTPQGSVELADLLGNRCTPVDGL